MTNMMKQLTDDLYNDELARKVVRFILIFQVSALFIGLIFTFTRLNALALFLAFVTLVLMLGALFWAFIRYQTYPIVQEKKRLKKKAIDLQAQIAMNTGHIQRARQKREELQREEQAGMQVALMSSQNEYIRSGMNAARIEDSDIPGIGHGLKQKLALHGFTSAASITSHVTSVEGFGPAKSQAVIDWRNRVHVGLNSAKPTAVTPEQIKIIREKYDALHVSNTEAESKHLEHKGILEKTLGEIQPRIQELAPISFRRYLRKVLATRGIAAGLIAAVLIGTQVCLGTSTTVGAIMASIPTATLTPIATLTPTDTLTPTRTFTPTISDTPTITFTPTITDTPTVTLTPSRTSTPTKTQTPTPSITLTRTKTRTPLPYIPPVETAIPPVEPYIPPVETAIPGPIGNCDPSYPTVCIPPPPPDLNCDDIPFRNFQVLPPDPHNFDGNHDGFGCQS